MSVKRRLFFSNMLMLIMPIVLMALTSIFFVFIYTGITGIRDVHTLKYGDVFFKRMDDVDALAAKWDSASDLAEFEADIDRFNQKHKGIGISLSLYAGQQLVYPASLQEGQPSDLVLSQKNNFMLVTDSLAVYRVEAGEYALVMADSNFTIYNRDEYQQRIYVAGVMFLTLIIVVLATNWALTKFVFRSIMNPIDTLVYGVHQLRDGNLTYRIQYDKKDEFAGVCAEFNEMAQRLSVMVNERQKDETNRRELIAGISHDLRTPLTSIKAYLEGIEKGVASTPQMQRKYFDIIKSKTASLEHIINQLFLFSKLDIGEFPLHLERVRIGEELQGTITVFAAEYEHKGLEIQVENRIREAEVFIDIVQFRNVLQNILENSLKYKNKDRARVSIVCFEGEHQVEIRLADDGPGVSDQDLEKLFDVFYRSDASRKKPDLGSGLGLAISSKLIERLGGSIRAKHADSGGLAIIIKLPKYTETGGISGEENIDH